MLSILEIIKVRSVIQFVAPKGFVVAKPSKSRRVNILTVDNYSVNFRVSWYQFQGGDQAKISLEQLGDPGFRAMGRPEGGGLKNPIIIAPDADQFRLTERGREQFSIEINFSPPAPFIQTVDTEEGTVLSYGFDSPEPHGLFSIIVLQ